MSDVAGFIGPKHPPKLARLIASRVYENSVDARRPTGLAATDADRSRTRTDQLELTSAASPHAERPAAHDPQPAKPADALPFYTNPAGRVEAATALAIGRTLDVEG